MQLQSYLLVTGLVISAAAPSYSQSIILPEDDPSRIPARVHQSSVGGFQSVSIDGYIHAPTVVQFEKALSLAAGSKGLVYLNSAGGDVEAAMQLGRAIRQSGYAVQTGQISVEGDEVQIKRGVCMSACPIAFFGGTYRIFDPSHGPLGVHQISKAVPGRWVEDNERILQAENDLSTYLEDMGIDLEILDLIRKTPPDDMALITTTQARHWNIETKHEVWEWHWAGSRLVGTTSSATGDARFQLWCDEGKINLQAGMKPWFPVAALLNYDTHSVTLNGLRFPVSEVVVSYDEGSGFLQMLTALTPDMIEALPGSLRIGYALDHQGKRDGYHRSMPLERRGADLNEVTAQCAYTDTN